MQTSDTIVVNTGDMIVVIEIVVPPYSTPNAVEASLRNDLLEVDDNLNDAIAPVALAIGLDNAIITSTIISQKPVIASPPPPRPDNITPLTDQSIIYIVVGSCVGLFLIIFLARECSPELISATRRLVLDSYDTLTSMGGEREGDGTAPRQKKSVSTAEDPHDPA